MKTARPPALLLALFLAGCGAKAARAPAEPEGAFLDGDVLLQHIDVELCNVIRAATGSRYSHCGMVVRLRGEPHVLEAIGPVRYTPLRKWITRGQGGRYLHLRPRDVSTGEIAKAVREAQKLLGRPYDVQYELDEEKIYCSELVYKAYLRGAGVEMGEKERLEDLNWRPHEKLIRKLAGGELPLERVMVTPESVASSPRLEVVYSNVPETGGR